MTPEEHRAHAEHLLMRAEHAYGSESIETPNPRSALLVRMAQTHAQLAQSPMYVVSPPPLPDFGDLAIDQKGVPRADESATGTEITDVAEMHKLKHGTVIVHDDEPFIVDRRRYDDMPIFRDHRGFSQPLRSVMPTEECPVHVVFVPEGNLAP